MRICYHRLYIPRVCIIYDAMVAVVRLESVAIGHVQVKARFCCTSRHHHHNNALSSPPPATKVKGQPSTTCQFTPTRLSSNSPPSTSSSLLCGYS